MRKWFRRIRYILRISSYRWRGMHIGEGVELRRCLYMDRPSNVYIGNDSFINRGCEFHIGAGGGSDIKIKIGSNVFVGMNVSFICVSHTIGDARKRAGVNKYGSITVEDGCWIGANTIFYQGLQ